MSRSSPSVLSILFAVFGVSLTVAVRADAGQSVANPRPILIPDATASGPGLAPVAPSIINIPRQLDPADRVRHIQIELRGLMHERLADLDILLVPPAASGRPAILLMSDVSNTYRSDWTLHLSDEAKLAILENGYPSGWYKATDNAPADTFPGLAPMTISTDLSSLTGMDPVGDWQLWVLDDQPGATGVLLDGWMLSFDLGRELTQSAPVSITSPAGAGVVQQASLWPSTIAVSGLVGHISWLRVTLHGLTHARPEDLEIVLRTPDGYCYSLLRDVGGSTPVNDIDVGIDLRGTGSQAAYSAVPPAGPLVSGVVAPSSMYNSPDANIAPASLGCAWLDTSFFEIPANRVNGDWKLYVADDTPGADGSLEAWTLDFGQEVRAPNLSLDESSSIFTPVATVPLSGRVSAYIDSPPVDAVRWRMRYVDGDYYSYSKIPSYYAEGPWVPLEGGPITNGSWSLPDLPLRWGRGLLCADVRTVLGGVVSSCRSIGLPEQPHYTLSEGATGTFFDLDVAIFNPTDSPAHGDIQFLKRDGQVVTQTLDLAPKQRRRLAVDSIPGLESAEVSTVVTPSTVTPLVVERAMFWDATRYGGHGANATEPATTWYFAEGAQGFYRTYILLANPNDQPADVTLRFLIEGGKPKDHKVTVAAHARETVDASTIPALASQAFGITVTSTRAIVAERAMYFDAGGRMWEGGHESTGVSEPARSWLLSEGATGGFFTTFVLVSNPNSYSTDVTMEFLKEDGSLVRKKYPLAGYGRLSVNIRAEHPALAATGVSTSVTATSDIVVERAMYWPGSPMEWTEAHNGFGVTDLSSKWGLADGRVGGALSYATYILLANPGDDAAFVDVLFVTDDGQQLTRSFKVEPHSRKTIDAASALGLYPAAGVEFSNVITTDEDTPIAVERATYWNSTDGRHWAGGSNVQGTRLP
jgi:subtilisin-like proprotein convertase family protein